MKETRYLVYLDEKGYVRKVTKEGDWDFTKSLKDSLKFKTITGAYIRLSAAKKETELTNLNSCILVVEDNDGELTVLSKLDYKLSKQRGRPRKETTIKETPVEEPKDVMEAESSIEEIKEEPKRRGRPRKIPTVPTDELEKLNEGVDKPVKRGRGRPRKETTIKETPTTTVQTNNVSEQKVVEEPLVKKKEEPTKLVENDLNVTVESPSTEDSFWD